MIRCSPAERYIKYLILHLDKYTDEAITKVLQERQLDIPDDDYLGRVRSKLAVPKVFYPFLLDHLPSVRFILKEGVYTLFHPDCVTKNALEILLSPKAKEIVESMAIVGDAPELTSVRLKKAGVGDYSAQVIRRYHHLFWDLTLVDSMELKGLISKRAEAGIEDDALKTALKRAQYTDPRYTAAFAPSSLMASVRLQLRMGYMPNKVDLARVVDATAILAVAGAHDAAINGGPRAAVEMRDYATAARELINLRQSLGSPDDAVMAELHQLAIKTSGVEVPGIDQLTSGDYTDGTELVMENKNE